jgi:hypothetical protein
MTTGELMKKIGKELARELSTSRDNNPSAWTPALERYIITTLKVNIVLRIFINITYIPNLNDISYLFTEN